MPDARIERGTCRFVARKDGNGRATIHLQSFHRTASILHHAALSLNLLESLTLEQATKLAAALNENVLDISISVSSEHPMFLEGVAASV
jgi:uncharacterized protein (UPF0548 family)